MIKNIVFPFRFTITYTFSNGFSSKEIKSAYEQLLKFPEFDGFSELNQNEALEGESSYAVVSSKNNELFISIDSDEVVLKMTNPFDNEAEMYGFSEGSITRLHSLLEPIKSKIRRKCDEVSVEYEEVIYDKNDPRVVFGDILGSFYPENAYGYTASYMQHIEDNQLSSKHTHKYMSVHNAYISEIRGSDYFEKLKDLNSYILRNRYICDSHDESLLTSDIINFFDKYTSLTLDDVSIFRGRLNLSEQKV